MKREDVLLELAIAAYYEVCRTGMQVMDRKGNVYSMLTSMQPSRWLSKVGRKYVHLRNINGDIARYNIKTRTITV